MKGSAAYSRKISESIPARTFTGQQPRLILLATGESINHLHTSYTVLARYLPAAELATAGRRDPRGLFQRFLVGSLARGAVTRWYRWGSLVAEWKAWRKCRSGDKSLIHVLWGDRDLGFLDLALRSARTPICATFHGCLDTLPQVLRYPSRLRRLNAILLMSEVQRPFFESCGIPSERIHVILHGVDTMFFCPAAQFVKPAFTVLSVGNYRRNFGRLRQVCLRLAMQPEIRVKVIAPPAVRSLFSDVPNVEFLSGLTDTELRNTYQLASCLLMTLDDATANNAVLEAMACGLPIISEDVGGIKEYTGQDAAKLCPPGSVEALAQAVLELRCHPERSARLAVAARARAEQLDWHKVAQRVLGLYQQLLAQSCTRFRTS